MKIEIDKEEWEEMRTDIKGIKNLLSGDEYHDGFIKRTNARLFRVEIVLLILLAFMVGVIAGNPLTLIEILS